MTEPVSLLPSNAGPWERAVSLTSAARRPMDLSTLRDILDPWRCPVHLLPWLAWGFSVDVWDSAWPEAKQRLVIATELSRSRLKTTPAGIKAYVALTGAEVRKIVRPPAAGYLVRTMTEQERVAWLADLPQIRIYPFANKASAGNRSFLNGPGGRLFFGEVFLQASRGPRLYGHRATFVADGVETPVVMDPGAAQGAIPVDRFFFTGTSGSRAFSAIRSSVGSLSGPARPARR
jgi:phage tail P2-like protein